jgi:uncharacterized alkaline shock family protein YloU
VPTESTPGRSIVTRRAVVDIVRAATLGSYGVTGLGGSGPVDRLLEWLGISQPGIRVALADELTVDLELTVGHGLPIAEVARQVDSAVRYALRRALGREVDRLTIHVDGLRFHPGEPPPVHPPEPAGRVRQDDLAGSGTDLAG